MIIRLNVVGSHGLITAKSVDMETLVALMGAEGEKGWSAMFVEISEGDVALRSIMILEDEALVALMMESVVSELGVDSITTFASCAEARRFTTEGDIDCALLDVRVRDGLVTEIADILMLRGIPIVFTSGSGTEILEPRFHHLPKIDKPFSDEALKLAVIDAVASRRTAFAPPYDASEGRVATPAASD